MISNKLISDLTCKLIAENIICSESPNAVLYDMSRYDRQLTALLDAFGGASLNALAIKANPIKTILTHAAKMGFGAECASIGELLIAKKSGFISAGIVFDSPTKTKEEIIYALREGIMLNIDNMQELYRIETILEESKIPISNTIGLRINPGLSLSDFPQLFTEEDKATITGLRSSKFGLLLDQARVTLTESTRYRDIITGLHLHVGSQKCPLEMLICGIRKVVDFAMELNDEYGFSISTINIGGGLSVRYKNTDDAVGFGQFAQLLRNEVPCLFDFRIVTEFGRSLHANSGWIVTKVEYTKTVEDNHNRNHRIALVQVGADLLLRSSYLNWYHDIIVLDNRGIIKNKNYEVQSIAGPLCFSGDFIARNRELPRIESGDWIVIKDAGAYTFCMWSHYNSRTFPPIYGYDAGLNLSILKAGETPVDCASFWE